eukprot:6246743-Amphidinium_carterae.1
MGRAVDHNGKAFQARNSSRPGVGMKSMEMDAQYIDELIGPRPYCHLLEHLKVETQCDILILHNGVIGSSAHVLMAGTAACIDLCQQKIKQRLQRFHQLATGEVAPENGAVFLLPSRTDR